jgi:hypothetical protein
MMRFLLLAMLLVAIYFLIRWAVSQMQLSSGNRTDEETVKTEPLLLPGKHSVEDRLTQIGESARARLLPLFERAGVPYPPERVALLGFKKEKFLDLYAAAPGGAYHLIHTYPILAASGEPGPKLREGDHQVPEGFYEIESLNPNSRFHLSLRLNYPNPEDLLRAGEDGRPVEDLGGDIMIHGRASSVGCLALGDTAIEELFVLMAEIDLAAVRVILSPCDFRTGTMVDLPEGTPMWTPALHENIRQELRAFRH